VRSPQISESKGNPFGIGGIWENWKEPAGDEWIRTFAIITTDANSLVSFGPRLVCTKCGTAGADVRPN
jgi:SOS response associated peptidase (SRAP)